MAEFSGDTTTFLENMTTNSSLVSTVDTSSSAMIISSSSSSAGSTTTFSATTEDEMTTESIFYDVLDLVENVTAAAQEERPQANEDASAVITGIVLYVLVLITLLGNLFVLLAVYREKALQTAFNFFIVNLAVTDAFVAITAMSFYATDMMLGYWPFGRAACAFWIFCDYGMTFTSVFTLVAISTDRFWSVYWSVNYRSINKRKKSIIMIAICWLLMLAMWTPALLVDRILNSAGEPEWVCFWDPSKNRAIVVVIAIVGHHGPCILMLAFFIAVYVFLRRRTKLKPVNKPPQRMQVAAVSGSQMDANASTASGAGPPGEQRRGDINCTPPTESTMVEDSHAADTARQDTEHKSNHLQVPNNKMAGNMSSVGSAPGTPSTSAGRKSGGRKDKSNNEANKADKRDKRERKVFITLTYIIVGYLVCWVPFHVVFDLVAIDPDLVPETAYNVAFWLTYLNSTMNPFLYNFSSSEFRDAFSKIFAPCKKTVREPTTSTANNQITPSV